MSNFEKYKAACKKYKLAKEKANEFCRIMFGELVKEIFEQYPDLQEFSWTQYTPHSNYEDSCVFWAHINELNIIPGNLNEHVGNLLRKISDDEYKIMFGDGVCVTVNRGGITVTEYDHD